MTLESLFKYRNGCMGVAILMIVYIHHALALDINSLESVKLICVGGVDIFIFASGIGCSYSLSRNPDAFSFLKRRAERILPTWWTFCLIWWALQSPQGFDLPWQSFFGNLFLVQALTDWHYSFNWYISALPIMYLLAPHFFALAARHSLWTIELALLTFTLPFIDQDYLIIVTRLPIFFAGFYVAKLARDGFILKRRDVIGLLAATATGLTALIWVATHLPTVEMARYGLCWYPFLLITPGLCLIIATILSKVTALDRILSTVGGLSFEIYLMHLMLLNIVNRLPDVGGTERALWFLATMILSAALHLVVEKIVRGAFR